MCGKVIENVAKIKGVFSEIAFNKLDIAPNGCYNIYYKNMTKENRYI